MHVTPSFLAQVVALLVASAVIAYVCQRLRILPIVGFLLAGVVIGPHALGLVEDAELVDAVAEIGIVLLLFTLGIEFSMERLARIRRAIFAGGGLQLGLTIAAAMGVLALLGVDWRTGFYTGALIALSSTAIVLKVLTDRNEVTSPKGQLALGILIFQDLAIVALVLVLPFLSGAGAMSPMALARGLGVAALIVVLVVVVARRVIPWILERVARACSPEIFLLTIIALCLGTAWLTNLAGVSLSLGAFLAGLVVSESRFSHHAFSEILPLQILFSAFFFVSVGMLLDLGFVARHPLLIVAVVLAVVLLKTIIIGVTARVLGYGGVVAGATAFLLAQIGEFSFVLERAGRAAGLYPADDEAMGAQTFIAAAVILMAGTPLLERASKWLESRREARVAEALTRVAETEAERVTLENHVIVAGYGSTARYLTRVLRDSGIPFVILTLSPTGASEAEREGLRVVLGDYSRRFLLELANIEAAKMLVVPDDTPDITRRVVAVARGISPTLRIVVRTHSAADADSLLNEGADQVLVDELELGVQLFTLVLTEYQVSPEEVDDHVDTVRAGGYAALRKGVPDAPIVVCNELDEECFDTRAFTVRRAMTIRELGIHVMSVERGSETFTSPPDDFALAVGDRVTARRLQQARTVALTDAQRNGCAHAASVQQEFVTTAAGCEDCLKTGDTWVHLRACMTCSGIRCCDTSKNQHATKHYHASGHPVIRSYQPGETWAWCYPDERML